MEIGFACFAKYFCIPFHQIAHMPWRTLMYKSLNTFIGKDHPSLFEIQNGSC